MSDSIKVAIKIRPLIKREKDDNLPVQWGVQDKTIFSVDPETKRRGEYSHVFDHIFGMDTNNYDVYEAIVKPIVEASVNGFNGTIFAYGQTSSGKTHTMMGTLGEPGIIPLAIENMFDVIANTSGREFLLRVSYLEIYNEKVNDLLHQNGMDLKIHEDINGQVIVKCKEEVTNCPQNVLSIMKKGDKRRRIGDTNMNERSSRSHTIFRITIESRETGSDADGAIQVSQLNLVDLAGSERARQTGATGDRFKEGRHINLSLSSLSLVIMQLSESKEHVNFRDSKLTRILQASLGGNAMTTIICAVTPAALDETQCTLAFASRAKSVKNKPQVNEVMSDAALLKRYGKQIAKLSAELEQERQTNRCAEVEKMESQLQEQSEYIQAITDRMELLKTRIVSAANSVENVDFKTKSRRRRTWGGASIPGMLNQSMPLPTIQESTSAENTSSGSRRMQYKKRRSIIHAPLDETLEFQTAIADFELELMESERNWEMGRFSSDSIDLEDNYYVSKREPGRNRIRFQDEPCVYPISHNENSIISPTKSEALTPPRRLGEKDSGTPKEVLRERITHLVDEYTTLQEFTTLEKQLYTKEKPEANDSDNMEAMLNHMKKSVADSEMLCLEMNKKYSDLHDKYLELELKYETSMQENEALKKQVERLSCMEESLRSIESEKSLLKADVETKSRRLKKLEEERNDYEFQVELLETKYKTREKELENSLQMAWKTDTTTSDTCDREKLSSIVHLQSLVDDLTKEVEALRSKSATTEAESLLRENETMMRKLEVDETVLKNERNERIKLMGKFERLRRRLALKPTTDRRDERLDLPDDSPIETNDSHTGLISSETLICDDRRDDESEMNTETIFSAQPEVTLASNAETTSDRLSSEELRREMNASSATMSSPRDSLRAASKENDLVEYDSEHDQAENEEQKLVMINLEERVAEVPGADAEGSDEYDDVVSKLNDIVSERRAVGDENMELKSKLLQNSIELKSNEELIDSLQADVAQLKMKLNEKNTELSDIIVKFEELARTRSQTESTLENATSDERDTRIITLEKELANKKSELTSKRREIEEYESKMVDFKGEITRKSEEILRLNDTLTELDSRNERLRYELKITCEEFGEQSAVKSEMQNGTNAIVSGDDSTLRSIRPLFERSHAAGTEPPKETVSDGEESRKLEETNSCIKVMRNSLSRNDGSRFSNGGSIALADSGGDVNDSIRSEKLHDGSEMGPGKADVSGLMVALERLTLENENLVGENARLKTRAESLVEEMKMLKMTSEKIRRVAGELEDALAGKADIERALAERDSELQELRIDNDRLRDRAIGMQSEKTSCEEERCATRKIIDENAVIVQRIPKLETEVEHSELEKEEFNCVDLKLRTNLNIECLKPESIDTGKSESDVRNLKSYTADSEDLDEKIRRESKDFENQSRIAEPEKITQSLGEDEERSPERIVELSKIKREGVVSVTTESPSVPEYSEDKLFQDEKEDSSIFANYISFDEMEVSVGDDSISLDKSDGDTLLTKYRDSSVSVAVLKRIIVELENLIKSLESGDTESIDDPSAGEDATKLSSNEVINRLYEFTNIRTSLEDDKRKLAAELRLKIQESDEIKNDVQGLRLGIEKLEQTIRLLTTENMEMSNKLTVEKDRAKEAIAAHQEETKELERRLAELTEEKVSLASELNVCQEHLDTLRANTPTGTEDEARAKIEEYQKKIDVLTTENISLSTDLMDKIEELDKMKESKCSPNGRDGGCPCADQVDRLTEKLASLNEENIELSNELMEKIEESDSMKHAYELLENKLAVSVRNQLSASINASQNELVELRTHNCRLKDENADLSTKLTTLTNENTKLSIDLSKALAASGGLRITVDEKLSNESSRLSRNSDDSSPADDYPTSDESVQMLEDKVEAYRLQVNELTRLNKKLGDLKLSSCAQCSHSKELNDSRKTLKLEVRNLNGKLEELQRKFERKCADTDILRSKAREELNSSAIADVTLNGSVSEGMNVSYVEEKIQSLNGELASLKENHEKLYALYKNKCSEVEKLNDTNLPEESVSEQEPDPPAPNNNRARIERVQGDIDKLREEIQQLKKRNTALSQSLERFINEKSHLQREIETLKKSKDDLNAELKNSEAKIAEAYESVSSLENEVADLNKLVDSLRAIGRDAENGKAQFEMEVEALKTERIANLETLERLSTSLESERESNAILRKDVETLIRQTAEVRKENDVPSRNVGAKSNDCSEERPILPENSEGLRLPERAADVEDSRGTVRDSKRDTAKLEEELKTAKAYITKEIRSLKPKIETSALSERSVDELLVDFLRIIMQKEQEIIKTVQERFDQERQSLEDAKRQSVNAERRVAAWAKELETDIERLQSDLSGQERRNVKLKMEVERLENDLKAGDYEKQSLKEKVEALEGEFNALQAELAKRSEVDNKQGKEAYAVQERERVALSLAKNREVELQNCIKSMKDRHNKELEELTFNLERQKSKNVELRSNLEGLEANECQLKSIIDLKSKDLAKLQQRASLLEVENARLSEACDRLNEENLKKDERVEEITNLVKIRSDKLSEYKTKLESIVPEYEILKDQINERKHYAEKYRNEYEDFREKAGKELDLMKDKLSDELIKSSSLSEQLTELNGENKLLLTELEELRSRCEDLEKSNGKLVNKMRNSTSNSRVEAQIEDLKDQNAALQKSVEGASNRITELQEAKNSLTKDLISSQRKYEMLAEEKRELERIVGSSKERLNSSDVRLEELRDKLQVQIQEKNKIALELEATKLAVFQKEKQLAVAQEEIEQLKLTNKELDEELDVQAQMIQDEIAANAKLRNEIFDLENGSERNAKHAADKARVREEEYQNTRTSERSEEVETLIEQNKKLCQEIRTTSKSLDSSRKENVELKAKITALESKRESRSCSSSRSSSPLIEDNRRKQRRSDLYNRGRSLEESSDALPAECRCSSLSQKVRELELEIVSRNGKIATLEMQIQSENFPYQKKCKDLEANLLAFRNKNAILKEEVKILQRAVSSTSAGECEICRKWQTNKRDQSTQCTVGNKTFLSGTSSGFVEDWARIGKLEKEKALMRELCRSRTREIETLHKQISEYESLLSEKSKSDATVPVDEMNRHTANENMKSPTNREKPQVVRKNTKRAMKENLSSNILDDASAVPSYRVRSLWDNYS